MSTNNEPTTTSDEESPFALVTVPGHLLDKVLAYLKELTGDEEEVTGLMVTQLGGHLPRGILGSGGTGPTYPTPPTTTTAPRTDQPTDIG